MTLSENIKYLRLKAGLTQDQLAEKLNYKSYTTIAKWESGVSEPPLSKTHELANIFNVNIDNLVHTNLEKPELAFIDLSNYVKIPVVGKIPAGVPVEAIEDIVDYIDIPEDWTKGNAEFIGLEVKGDSMYPIMLDGDRVVIRVQPSAETGDICACYVNGYDATLKRIALTSTSITLKPENPSYPPKTYTHPGEVTIVGKVVEIRRKV